MEAERPNSFIQVLPESQETHDQDTIDENNGNYKKYLDFYNLKLPTRTSLTNNPELEVKSNGSLEENLNSPETTEFNKSLEYFSLGMNSSGSNSRCSSPSNSVDSGSIKESQSRQNLDTLNQAVEKIEQINLQSFTNSSIISSSTSSNSIIKTLPQKPELNDDTGISSLRLSTPSSNKDKSPENTPSFSSANSKFTSPKPSSERKTKNSKPLKANQETPLLSSLLLQSKY